jgi:hypothetical protein
MKNQKIFIFCALLCITLLCACFSTWDGSGETGKVALKNPGTPGVEEYTVILTSPGRSSIESEPTRDSIIVIDVPPGIWNIEVREEGPEGLTALGDEKVEVKPGETKEVPVPMFPATQAKDWAELIRAFNNSRFDNEPKSYIEITKDIPVNDTVTISGNKKITLRANKNVTITMGNNVTRGSLFQINDGNELTLGGIGQGTITITGNANNTPKSLIKVSGPSGKLTMNEGVTLTGNTTSGDGGGVYVDGGTFTMYGGIISGNMSDPPPNSGQGTPAGGGGGVYLNGGSFIMHNGTISDNTTTGHGGGVRVYGGGTFIMHGGTISGNTSGDFAGGVRVSHGSFTMNGGTISGNSAKDGGGVCVGENNQTFIMNGGTISGNTATGSKESEEADGRGGGVYVQTGGNFTKPRGGTISGNIPDNIVE